MAHDISDAAPDRPGQPRPPAPRRQPGTEKIEKTCDTIILALLASVLVLTPIAFGGAEQDLAPFSKTPFGTVLYYFMYYVAAAAVLMVLAWAVKMLLTERIVLARTPMDLPLLLLLAYAFVRALTCAAPAVSLREVGWMAAYGAIFYVAVNTLRTRRQQHTVAIAIVATAVALTVIGLIQALAHAPNLALTLERPKQYFGRLGASYVCPNHYAGYLEMAIPLVLAFIMIGKGHIAKKIVAGTLGLALVTGIIFSMSRGAWIGLALGIIFLLVVATTQKKINVLAWVVPLIVIIATVVMIIVQDPRVRQRFKDVANTEDRSYAGRALAWKHTLDMVQRHPLFGTGPGTYRWAYTQAQPAQQWLDVRYTHNDYLHTFADYGVVGLGLVLWAAAAFGFRGVRALRRLKRSNDLALATGIMAGAVAMAAHTFVDFNMRIPANLITMLVLAALLVAIRQYQLRRFAEIVVFRRSGKARLRLLTKIATLAAVALAALAILIVNGRKHSARVAYHRGRELDVAVREGIAEAGTMTPRQQDERQERVITSYQEAIRIDRSNFEFHSALLGTYLWKGANSGVPPLTMLAARNQLELDLRRALKEDSSLQLADILEEGERVAKEESRPERILLALLVLLRSEATPVSPLKLRKADALTAFNRAIPYGKEAFRLNPLSARVAFDMGETYKLMYGILTADDRSGTLDRSAYISVEECEAEARRWYHLALKLHPENGLYRRGYGEFLELTGELRSALEQYRKGMEIAAKKQRIQRGFEQKSFERQIRRVEKELVARRKSEAPERDRPEGPTPGPESE